MPRKIAEQKGKKEKVVDLKAGKPAERVVSSGQKASPASRRAAASLLPDRKAEIEELFSQPAETKTNDDRSWQTINRPKGKNFFQHKYNGKIFAGLFVLLLLFGAWYFLAGDKSGQPEKLPAEKKWYAVKLASNEVFYGEIADTSSDPVVMENVYYNYDQINKKETEDKTIDETGNIRLVKRGKETHGPDGSLDVVRSQILFMEPLKSDSKVLQAIFDYEKKD